MDSAVPGTAWDSLAERGNPFPRRFVLIGNSAQCVFRWAESNKFVKRKAGNSTPPFNNCKLLPDAESCNDSSVTFNVNFLEVVEQTTTLTDHLQQTTTGMVILLVGLEVLGEVADALRQQSNLNLGGTGIALVESVLSDDFILAFFFHY